MCDAARRKMTAQNGYIWFLPSFLSWDWYDTDHHSPNFTCKRAEMEEGELTVDKIMLMSNYFSKFERILFLLFLFCTCTVSMESWHRYNKLLYLCVQFLSNKRLLHTGSYQHWQVECQSCGGNDWHRVQHHLWGTREGQLRHHGKTCNCSPPHSSLLTHQTSLLTYDTSYWYLPHLSPFSLSPAPSLSFALSCSLIATLIWFSLLYQPLIILFFSFLSQSFCLWLHTGPVKPSFPSHSFPLVVANLNSSSSVCWTSIHFY